MKFNHYLTGINRDCPEVYKDRFLKYKLLKKLLKNCDPAHQDECTEGEARFFDELRQELAATNRHFALNAHKIISTYQTSHSDYFCGCFSIQRRRRRKNAELAKRAYWCRKYARANAVALRKILKKHDKTCKNTAGRVFLQECWRSDVSSGVGLFLHSPLLDELKAIQDVLQSQMPPEDPDLVERVPAPTQAASKKTQQAESGAPQQLELCLRTESLAIPVLLPRSSVHSSSDTGAPESTDSWGGTDFGQSFTSPSLKQQRQQGLSAIAESPTCMLNTADIEWCPVVNAPHSPPPALNTPLHAQLLGGELGQVQGLGCSAQQGASQSVAAAGAGESDAGGMGAEAAGVAAEAPLADGLSGLGNAVGLSDKALSKFSEEELKCPICLDVMYKPVGLGCGHKFCRQCALEAAGFGTANGAFHNICSHIPLRAGCPQCRQTGVYRDAVALQEVGRLIQTRFPEDWAERRQEEKERYKQQSAEAARLQRQVFQSQNAFELLFAI